MNELRAAVSHTSPRVHVSGQRGWEFILTPAALLFSYELHFTKTRHRTVAVCWTVCSVLRMEAVKPTPDTVLGFRLYFRPPWQVLAAVTPPRGREGCRGHRPPPDRLHRSLNHPHTSSPSDPSDQNRKESSINRKQEAENKPASRSSAALKD